MSRLRAERRRRRPGRPWRAAETRGFSPRPRRSRVARLPRRSSLHDRGQFLLDYVELLLKERVERGGGVPTCRPGADAIAAPAPARGRERWVINKLRALGSWYSKGLEGGSQLRTAVNSADSIDGLQADYSGVLRSGSARSPARSVVKRPNPNSSLFASISDDLGRIDRSSNADLPSRRCRCLNRRRFSSRGTLNLARGSTWLPPGRQPRPRCVRTRGRRRSASACSGDSHNRPRSNHFSTASGWVR